MSRGEPWKPRRNRLRVSQSNTCSDQPVGATSCFTELQTARCDVIA